MFKKMFKPKFQTHLLAGKILLITLGVTLATSLILGYLLAGEIYDYQDSVDGVHLPQVDAIVCLAGGRGRIALAGDIWYRYWEATHLSPFRPPYPILYLSGVGHRSNWTMLTHQFRRGVTEVIQEKDVVLEKESMNTITNAKWLAQYITQSGWKKILLITSPYHMKRAIFIFDRVFKASDINIKIESISVYQEPFDAIDWRGSFNGLRVTLMEYSKWLYYKYVWRPN